MPAHPVERVVDTTGAGDLYAAGFLYGYTQGMAHDRAGRLGSIAASAVIGHTGARPGMSLAQLLDALERLSVAGRSRSRPPPRRRRAWPS